MSSAAFVKPRGSLLFLGFIIFLKGDLNYWFNPRTVILRNFDFRGDKIASRLLI
jgi:hypothetical protein